MQDDVREVVCPALAFADLRVDEVGQILHWTIEVASWIVEERITLEDLDRIVGIAEDVLVKQNDDVLVELANSKGHVLSVDNQHSCDDDDESSDVAGDLIKDRGSAGLLPSGSFVFCHTDTSANENR